MPNQLFYPKTALYYRITTESDNIYLPSPKHMVTDNLIAGAGTAGAVLEYPTPLAGMGDMIKVGDIVYNNEIGDIKRGQATMIKEVDYTTNAVTLSTNIGITAAKTFRIYKNKPDPCLILQTFIDKNDVLALEDAEGNQFVWIPGSPSTPYVQPLPIQVTKVLKTNTSIAIGPSDYILCLRN
tara:strand:- start:433 stop:978 length:546 start_codon:yes stop_codon:yes gene_type:complete